MSKSLKYQLHIGQEDSTEQMTDLGNGQVAIVHDSEYHSDLYLIDIHKGEIMWSEQPFETYGGVTRPMVDDNVLYAPFAGNPEKLKKDAFAARTQTICAFDLSAGKQLWARSMGNSKYQFMVPYAMTNSFVASVNSDNGKMTILNKSDGKVSRKIEIAHDMEDYKPYLLAWNEMFVAIGKDKKTKQFAIDLYDPNTEEVYQETLFLYPNKGVNDRIDGAAPIIVGDCLYFTTRKGLFCKFDLIKKEIREHRFLEVDEDNSPRISKQMMCDSNMVYFVVSYYEKEYACIYDIKADSFLVKLVALKNWITQLYEGKCYYLTQKGIACLDLLGGNKLEEISLDQWGDHIDKVFLENSRSGSHWLICEGNLLVMPRSKKKQTDNTGVLLCWEI